MRKYVLTTLMCLMYAAFARSQPPQGTSVIRTAKVLLEQMHQRYYKGPCKIYTFSQKNTHYRNDSVVRHSEWHEAVEFPDRFRINFGDGAAGNFVIFKNDSVFNYKENKLVKMRADPNTLLLLLGGMYYRELPDVQARLKQAGFDTGIFSEQTWNQQPVYVVGALANDLVANQVWIDKKTLRVLRIIEKINDKDTMDMRFEAHQDWCKGYVETKVSFRRNGKLEQVEEYYDIKVSERFPME
jgi:hypothetical protein